MRLSVVVSVPRLLGGTGRNPARFLLSGAQWVEVARDHVFAAPPGLHLELQDIAKLKSECRPSPTAGGGAHLTPQLAGGGHT